MAEQTEPQARLDQLVQSIATNMIADVCSIYVRRADDTLELFATEGLNRQAIHATRLRMDEGLVGWVARNRRPLRTLDAPKHEAFSYRQETGEDPLNTFLGVPIVRSGQVIGVLVVQNINRRIFDDDEVEIAQTVATILAEIVSAGELLEERDRRDVEAVLEKPEYAVGSPVVPGIARGRVVLREPPVRQHPPFAKDVAEERKRLGDAIATVQKSVDDMVAGDRNLNAAAKEVLEVFRLFAYDKGWSRRLDEKVLSGLSAESAVEQVQAENRKRMRSVSDPYLRERLHDLDDLTRRLLRALSGEHRHDLTLTEDAVLLADSLGPAELLELDARRLKGLVLADGATTSHAAIIARAMGVPMVSGVGEIVDRASEGDEIVLDGATGQVHLRPPRDVVAAFDDKAAFRSKKLARYAAERDLPAVTKDGVQIELQMNAGLLFDMPHLQETGARSIGLFRTELQFLLGRSLPTAADQEAFYSEVIEAAQGRPVTFRTADIGSDKRAAYMVGPRETNPAMGWRGLRVAVDRPALMRTQVRALLSATKQRPLHILLPLVTTASEMIAARKIIRKEMSRHETFVGPLPSEVRVGAMIEIPAAAWAVADIAAHSDFLSIGGNDLAQFFFAADRDSEGMSRRYDPLAPSFLSFLKRTIATGQATGKSVGYCGEQAADPYMALALLALGLDRLSVAASAIGPLRAMIRSVHFETLKAFIDDHLQSDVPSIRAALRSHVADAGIDLPDSN
jgi:phosphotransferase system enzyme I (PtsP)